MVSWSLPFIEDSSKARLEGETIGHESGRKIIKILEKNPKKDPSKYEEEDVQHMRKVGKHVKWYQQRAALTCRKVVSYCKRHLAQEETAKKNPDSKSAKSLKNWGHNPEKDN